MFIMFMLTTNLIIQFETNSFNTINNTKYNELIVVKHERRKTTEKLKKRTNMPYEHP